MRMTVGQIRALLRETLQETGAYYGKNQAAIGQTMPTNGSDTECPCGDPSCNGDCGEGKKAR